MPLFQRRHYDALAAALHPHASGVQLDMFTVDQHIRIVKRLSAALAADNPNFRREQFERAAGLPEDAAFRSPL